MQGVIVRIGHRSAPANYISVRITRAESRQDFLDAVQNSVRANPDDPLIISVNGYNHLLASVFASCIEAKDSTLDLTNRQVQHFDAVQLPQSADRRAGKVPWTFIVDQMNLAEVWFWSFEMSDAQQDHFSSVDNYRFRIGAWICDQGAYRFNDKIPVIFIFTRPDAIAESIVSKLLFPHMLRAASSCEDQSSDDAVCWFYFQLYLLLSDWQNIIKEVGRKLNQAEIDSNHRDLPVKIRTRRLHKEVDRIYELHEYMHFHSRSFRKLLKFKKIESIQNKHGNTVWEAMDDAIGDLEQYDAYLVSMKERFNNLIELEFNLENAAQSSNARFISILGAIFLPISFVASIFGITSVSWPVQWYIWAAVPIFILSLFLTLTVPEYISLMQARANPSHIKRISLRPEEFTLLGREMPENDNASVMGSMHEHSTSSSEKCDGTSPKQKAHGRHKYHGPHCKRRDSQLSQNYRASRQDRPSTGTLYRIHRSPGVVGSHRKNLQVKQEANGNSGKGISPYDGVYEKSYQYESPMMLYKGDPTTSSKDVVHGYTASTEMIGKRGNTYVDIERLAGQRRWSVGGTVDGHDNGRHY